MGEVYIVTVYYQDIRTLKDDSLDVNEFFGIYNSRESAEDVISYVTGVARNHLAAGFAKNAVVCVLRYSTSDGILSLIQTVHC